MKGTRVQNHGFQCTFSAGGVSGERRGTPAAAQRAYSANVKRAVHKEADIERLALDARDEVAACRRTKSH